MLSETGLKTSYNSYFQLGIQLTFNETEAKALSDAKACEEGPGQPPGISLISAEH